MIRTGILVMTGGIVLMLLPVSLAPLAGLVVTGLGAAPVYPCVIHATPDNFGRENSQALVGIQMASAYTGTTLMPSFFGLIAQNAGVNLYPWYLLALAVLMLCMTESLNRTIAKGRRS